MQTPMTIEDAIEKSKTGEVVVIDLREPGEIAATGAAVGALRLPLGLLPLKAPKDAPDRPEELQRGLPIALYCAAGGRAERGKDLLLNLGYTDVHNIGGLAHWVAAGGPIEP
jgi:rhodanese-related sulfurtransferase